MLLLLLHPCWGLNRGIHLLQKQAWHEVQKQPPGVFCKKRCSEKFHNLTGKELCWSPFLTKLQAFCEGLLLEVQTCTVRFFHNICRLNTLSVWSSSLVIIVLNTDIILPLFKVSFREDLPTQDLRLQIERLLFYPFVLVVELNLAFKMSHLLYDFIISWGHFDFEMLQMKFNAPVKYVFEKHSRVWLPVCSKIQSL